MITKEFVEITQVEVATYLYFNQMFDKLYSLDEEEKLKPITSLEKFTETIAYSNKFYMIKE